MGEPAEETGTIYFVYEGEMKVYDRLSTMLQAILECYETGAYAVQGDEVVADEPRVAQIKAHWNPCRVELDGTILGVHP